ncbi:hypothetical protein [Paraburkholderia silvatlantica]|uniref:hypothetical protein n=1 Tax=Paraburkholderia silvatlantica TaxID=321895 RepID=UPI0015E8AB05|nr:hypothetical protein [Paraburkholderia silvatlantica]
MATESPASSGWTLSGRMAARRSPVKVVSEGESREPIETVLMENLRIDVPESQLKPFG